MMSSGKPQEHRQRASTFYKMVLKWQRERGHGHNHSRKAAIGLPDAIRADDPESHVRRFIFSALKDGMPLEVILHLSRQV